MEQNQHPTFTQNQHPTFTLNEQQINAFNLIKKFTNSKQHNMLLMGPAGTGKTTIITRALANTTMRICFCAFTNKAVTVLRNAAQKAATLNAHFCTIHQLLGLEPNPDENNNLNFTYEPNKQINILQYDIIILDECSTISQDLFRWFNCSVQYAKNRGHHIWAIYLGDFWQLPPVGENRAVVFARAKEQHWPVAKLAKVMRVNDSILDQLNTRFIELTKNIKAIFEAKFLEQLPYSLVPDLDIYIAANQVPMSYVTEWLNGNEDIIIITYSRDNCAKINRAVQEILDNKRAKSIQASENNILSIGNRVCLERPVLIHSMTIEPPQKKLFEGSIGNVKIYVNETNLPTTKILMPTDTRLFNGEIFDIVDSQPMVFNALVSRDIKQISGHLIQIKRIGQQTPIYTVPAISKDTALIVSRSLYRNKDRHTILANFYRIFAVFEPGYCITLYKAQGSEWNTVYVNLTSIKWSILREPISDEQIIQHFSACYTAISRASNKIYCF